MSTDLSLHSIVLSDFLSLERTLNTVQATSKKKVLETIAKIFSANIPSLKENILFEQLIQREKLGSTAISHGCAIPHCQTEEVDQIYACFLKLSEGIDFDSPDNEAVDLVFAIVVPTHAHETYLNVLAHIANVLRNEELRKQLRRAESHETLYQLLTHT